MLSRKDIVLLLFVTIGCIIHTSVAITLKIAWLAPKSSVRATVNSETSVGALKLALNMIQKNNILKGHTVSIKYFPVTCEVNSVVGTVLGLRRTFKPDVIVGPPCQSGFETIGLLAADWNIPLLSWYNTGSELDDSTKYPTTLRLIPSVSFLGSTLINLVKQLQQKKFLVLHYQSNPWEPTKKSVVQQSRQAGLSAIPVPVERDMLDNDMRQLISSVKGVPVLALICPADLVRQIMLIAADLGMTDGNYVFIWLDPEMHVGSVLSDSCWKKGDNFDTKAKTAYKHLIRVVYNPMYDATSPPASTPTNKFDDFSRLVATRSQVNNPAWQLPVAGKPDIYSMYLYDAILFWSAVTNKLLQSNSKFRDGRMVAEEAKLFEARGASGFISLNKNLDRHGKVFVIKMAENGLFKPVQIFRSTDQGTDHVILQPLGLTNFAMGKKNPQTSKTNGTLAKKPTTDTEAKTKPDRSLTTPDPLNTQSKITTTSKPTAEVTVSSPSTTPVNQPDQNATMDKQQKVSEKELNEAKADLTEKETTTQENISVTKQAEIVENKMTTPQTTPIPTQAEIVENKTTPQTTPIPTQAEIVENKPTTPQTTPIPTQAEIVEKEVPAQQTTPVVAEGSKLKLQNKTVAVENSSTTTKQPSPTVKPTTTQKPTVTTSQKWEPNAGKLTHGQRQIWRQVMRDHYQSMVDTMREELGLPELVVPVRMLDNFIAQNSHLFDPTTTVPMTSSVATKTTKTSLNMGEPRKTFIIVNSNNLPRNMGNGNNHNRLVGYLSKLIRNISRNSAVAARIPPTTTMEYSPTEEPWWMA